MEFVWWLTGMLAMITASRFVILVFRKVTSKENMNRLLDKAGDGMNHAADKVTDYIRDKKRRKNEPIVTIH